MEKVKRITVSIPDNVNSQLEEMISDGDWKNRSQIITKLIQSAYVKDASKKLDVTMAGSLTVFYNESQREILTKVIHVQRENIKEVISSNRVLLEDDHVMELMVVQGKLKKLEEVQQQFLNIKGVETGKLVLTNIILPPIQK